MRICVEQLSEGWVVRDRSQELWNQFKMDKDYLMARLLGWESAGDYGDYFVEYFNGFYSGLNYLHFHTKEDAEKARAYMEPIIMARKLAGILGEIDKPRGTKSVS